MPRKRNKKKTLVPADWDQPKKETFVRRPQPQSLHLPPPDFTVIFCEHVVSVSCPVCRIRDHLEALPELSRQLLLTAGTLDKNCPPYIVARRVFLAVIYFLIFVFVVASQIFSTYDTNNIFIIAAIITGAMIFLHSLIPSSPRASSLLDPGDLQNLHNLWDIFLKGHRAMTEIITGRPAQRLHPVDLCGSLKSILDLILKSPFRGIAQQERLRLEFNALMCWVGVEEVIQASVQCRLRGMRDREGDLLRGLAVACQLTVKDFRLLKIVLMED